MAFCAYCGHEVSDQAAACPECGHPRSVPSGEPDRVTRMLLPVGRSGWAIAAGYVALFGIVIFPLAPLGGVLALLAVRDIRRHPQRHGMGRAVFALVIGAAWMLAFVGFVVYNVARR